MFKNELPKQAFSENRSKSEIQKSLKFYTKIGKPMKHGRKGTREVYVAPYRLAYSYIHSENKIIFLDIYHKDEQ